MDIVFALTGSIPGSENAKGIWAVVLVKGDDLHCASDEAGLLFEKAYGAKFNWKAMRLVYSTGVMAEMSVHMDGLDKANEVKFKLVGKGLRPTELEKTLAKRAVHMAGRQCCVRA